MPYRIFNTEEVAQYLNLSAAEVERLVKDRAIPFEMRGDRTVFRRPEIDAWASQRILGLSATRLAEYHQKWSQRSPSLLNSHTLIADLLPAENIDSALPAKTKASVIREMAALADRTGFLYDAAELVSSLEAREELCSTAVPGGVAFLHPRVSQPYRFEASFLVLGRTVQPIFYGSPDAQASDLFFLVCCQDDKLHLHTLARLCLMAQKTDILTELRAAADAEQMHEFLVAAEEKVVARGPSGQGRG
jgi:excisionase family DNA binding protein